MKVTLEKNKLGGRVLGVLIPETKHTRRVVLGLGFTMSPFVVTASALFDGGPNNSALLVVKNKSVFLFHV